MDLIRHVIIFYASNSKICVNEFMVIWQSWEMVFINVETAAGEYICKRRKMALKF